MSQDNRKEQESLIKQLKYLAKGLGETFTPFCEVVVHDLRDPKSAIVAIENPLSGRSVGDPATQLGLARISDDRYPPVLANYPNRFADGRQVKSTSIGIRDSTGKYVATLCLNIDLTQFHGFTNILTQFAQLSSENLVQESLDPTNAASIRAMIDQYAAARSTTPRQLKTRERRTLVQELKAAGFLELRYSADIISQHLGVSRATVYADAK